MAEKSRRLVHQAASYEDDDNREDEDDDLQGGDDTEYFPVSHEIVMKDHTKARHYFTSTSLAFR
jgi:hypothetical protein